MSKQSDGYLAIKNLIHNTCGLGREEIKNILRECVQDAIRDELTRFFQTRQFKSYLDAAMFGGRYGSDIKNGAFASIIAEQVKAVITEKYDIKIDVK